MAGHDALHNACNSTQKGYMYIVLQTYVSAKTQRQIDKLVLVTDARVWTEVEGKRTTEKVSGVQVEISAAVAKALHGVGVPCGRPVATITPEDLDALGLRPADADAEDAPRKRAR